MSRQFWTATTKPSEIKRLNKKLIIPAFSANCGARLCSLQFKGSGTACTYSVGSTSNNPFTLEFWIKPLGGNGLKFIAKEHAGYSFYATIRTNQILEFEVYGSTGTHVTLNTGIAIASNVWQHFAITRSFSAGTTTIQFYLNGNLVYTGTTAAIANDYATAASWTFGGSIADGTLFNGYIGEIRIWNAVRTGEQINYGYNKRLAYPTNNIIIRFPCNDTTPLLAVNYGSDNDIMVLNGGTVSLTTLEYPPLIYGASFIAAKASVANLTSSENLSLKFPLIPPSNINFALAISWTDFNNVFQRRLLWNPDASVGNIDWAPQLVYYNGERLPPTFDFEIINIDGKATCDLVSDYTVELSNTSLPNDSTDITEVSVGTLTIDKTLAQNFPLTPFPLTFNVQQVY